MDTTNGGHRGDGAGSADLSYSGEGFHTGQETYDQQQAAGMGGFMAQYLMRKFEEADRANEPPAPFLFDIVRNSAPDSSQFHQVKPRSLSADLAAENTAVPLVHTQPSPASTSHEDLLQHFLAPRDHMQQRTNVFPTDNISHQRFTLKANDLPPSLKLEGLASEDVPEKMALYRAHIALLSPDNPNEATVDHRAIKHLALFVRGAAAQSVSLILSSSLEWRPGTVLEPMRVRGERITISPPRTWTDWVTALTTLFAPANRISILARDVMTL